MKERGFDPTVANAAETVMWMVAQGGAQGIVHAMDEDELRRSLRHPWQRRN